MNNTLLKAEYQLQIASKCDPERAWGNSGSSYFSTDVVSDFASL